MKTPATLLVIGILFITVSTAQAQIVNGGFEADPVGTFDVVTGWEVIGKTSILDATSNVTPTEGSKQLLLSTFGTGVATRLELAEFIFGPGTDPDTHPFFQDGSRGRIIAGSAIKQTFTFAAGDSLFYDKAHVSAEPFSGYHLKKVVGDLTFASIGPGGVTTPGRFFLFFSDPDFMDIAGRPGGALVATQRINYMMADNFLGFSGPGSITLIFAEFMVEGLGDAGSGVLLDNIRLVTGRLCVSNVLTFEELREEILSLDATVGTVDALNGILDKVQRELDKGNNEEARTRMGKFIRKVIDGSNPERGDPPRIFLDEANNLICGASNLLKGIGLQ